MCVFVSSMNIRTFSFGCFLLSCILASLSKRWGVFRYSICFFADVIFSVSFSFAWIIASFSAWIFFSLCRDMAIPYNSPIIVVKVITRMNTFFVEERESFRILVKLFL